MWFSFMVSMSFYLQFLRNCYDVNANATPTGLQATNRCSGYQLWQGRQLSRQLYNACAVTMNQARNYPTKREAIYKINLKGQSQNSVSSSIPCVNISLTHKRKSSWFALKLENHKKRSPAPQCLPARLSMYICRKQVCHEQPELIKFFSIFLIIYLIERVILDYAALLDFRFS